MDRFRGSQKEAWGRDDHADRVAGVPKARHETRPEAFAFGGDGGGGGQKEDSDCVPHFGTGYPIRKQGDSRFFSQWTLPAISSRLVLRQRHEERAGTWLQFLELQDVSLRGEDLPAQLLLEVRGFRKIQRTEVNG